MNILPILDNLLLSLTNDKVTSWLTLVILFLCVWLFKEVRRQYLEDNKEAISRIDKAIEAYGALEISILSYLNNECEETKKTIFEKVAAMYPYFQIFYHSNNLSFFLLNFNRSKLEELLKIINNDLNILVKEQSMRVHVIKGEGSISRINYFIDTTLSSLFGPVITTIVTLIIFAFVGFVVYAAGIKNDWQDKTYIYAVSMA